LSHREQWAGPRLSVVEVPSTLMYHVKHHWFLSDVRMVPAPWAAVAWQNYSALVVVEGCWCELVHLNQQIQHAEVVRSVHQPEVQSRVAVDRN
jgi:hypothetical protein